MKKTMPSSDGGMEIIMKLGAQFYTLRERAKTPEGLRACFSAMHDIGYEAAQMSGVCRVEAEVFRSLAEEFSLPITCTHTPFSRITEETDAVIAEHKIYGCPVIGVGSMPNEYRGSVEGVRAFLRAVKEPMKKIKAAGLRFAYHNHAFEFDDLGGTDAYSLLIEEAPDLNFILDTYWCVYAGKDPARYIRLFGGERMSNIHFKDMKSSPKGDICPCGAGIIDFAPYVKLCDELGIRNALVEQDNAPDLGDEFEQMAFSYRHLIPLF